GNFCSKRGIPVEIGRENVSKRAKDESVSIEMAARSARYEFYKKVADKKKSAVIALGHTADDRIENLFLRLFRGAGGHGLGSLRLKKQIGPLLVLRPLIGVFRTEIIDYLETRGLSYRIDSSNLSTETDRCKIRNVIIPDILKLAGDLGWSGVKESLSRSSELLSDDEGYFDEIVSGYISQAKYEEKSLTVPVGELKKLPSPILRRVVIALLQSLNADIRPEREHVLFLEMMVRGERRGSISLPGDFTAEMIGENMRIGHRGREGKTRPEPVKIFLAGLPVEFAFGKIAIGIFLSEKSDSRTQTSVGESQVRVYLSIPDGCREITIRAYENGDRMKPMGMEGHSKKVGDIFTDRKIPIKSRAEQPVVVDTNNGKNEIIAIPALGLISETARVTDRSTRIIRMDCRIGPQPFG
ncbi:MAG: tRNA lysidine(34) synthetase TilS, partial [bacterium]